MLYYKTVCGLIVKDFTQKWSAFQTLKKKNQTPNWNSRTSRDLKQPPEPWKRLTLARTSHCLKRHFCRILLGPPNFFMSLQKSHWAQSSVRLHGSHSPHMRTERFTCRPQRPRRNKHGSAPASGGEFYRFQTHRLRPTLDPRRLSLL